MPLKNVNEMLKEADQQGKAVVAFDCFNYDSAWCVIHTAEKLGIPVIIMFFPGDIPASTFAAIVRDLAGQVSVDVGLLLDHGDSYESAMVCIRSGFPSVMIDCSTLSFEENIKRTKEVVRTAHLFGVDVEAELGHVGDAFREEDYKGKNLYADPQKVAEFVQATGVDSLAVAIGSAHGNYVSTPKLDLDRLEEINQVTDIPLVLHGGSGIPFDQVQEAIRRGLNKLNIGTEYDQHFARTYRDILIGKKDSEYMYELTPRLLERTEPYIAKHLKMAWMYD